MEKKKTDLRVIKTKKAIYNALYRLLKKKSLDKITVVELAEAAEINKATFYLHYSDIYALYQEAMASHIKDLIIESDMLKYLFDDPKTFTTWLVNDFWNKADMADDPFLHDQNFLYNRTLSYYICKAFTEAVLSDNIIEETDENILKLEFFFTGTAFLRDSHPEEENEIIANILADTIRNLFK